MNETLMIDWLLVAKSSAANIYCIFKTWTSSI